MKFGEIYGNLSYKFTHQFWGKKDSQKKITKKIQVMVLNIGAEVRIQALKHQQAAVYRNNASMNS